MLRLCVWAIYLHHPSDLLVELDLSFSLSCSVTQLPARFSWKTTQSGHEHSSLLSLLVVRHIQPLVTGAIQPSWLVATDGPLVRAIVPDFSMTLSQTSEKKRTLAPGIGKPYEVCELARSRVITRSFLGLLFA